MAEYQGSALPARWAKTRYSCRSPAATAIAPLRIFHTLLGAVARLLGLDFVDMLRLMRLLGLATFTLIAGYAIAVTPILKWAFVLIALLPVSIYNRSVLSADGAAFSSALLITALCLSAAWKGGSGRIWERSLWMTLCALSKQPKSPSCFWS